MLAFLGRAGAVLFHWCLALFLFGVSGLLIGFRDFLPIWLAMVVANMIVGCSIVMIHRGTFLMLKKQPPDLIYLSAVILTGLVYYHFTYINPNTGARIFFVSVLRIPFFISVAVELRASVSHRMLKGARALIWILFTCSLWYLFRGCFAISSNEMALLFRTGPMQGVNFLIASVFNIVITISLSRIEAEQAISRTIDLASQLKELSDGLAAEIEKKTKHLKQEVSDRMQAQYELQVEHHRLSISEKRLFRTFDQAPIGATMVDIDGHYIRVNREFEKITGYKQSELQKLTVSDITHPDDREVSVGNAQALLSRQISQAEEIKRYIRKDGQDVWVHVFVRIMRDDNGEPLLFLPMMADITDKRNADNELKAAKEKAEQALKNLLSTQDSLIHAEKMAALGRLVAGAAHEINTPLGVSLTVASLIADRFKSIETKFDSKKLRRSVMEEFISEVKEGCGLLLANLHRSADLVQSFKQVATDQTSEQRRVFDLGVCISETLLTISPIWRKAGHRAELISPENIYIDGYPGVISQIITNLVTNSVVHAFYSGQFGIINIALETDGNDSARITYCDNGKGVPSEIHDKIFEPFFTTRRASGSTGLGLHIVYNLVWKLGGSIALSPDYEAGAMFIMTFPRVAIS